MHSKRAPIWMLYQKSKLRGELGQSFVEAEQACGDQDETDGKQEPAGLNAFRDQCAEWRCQQSANQQPAGHNCKRFQSDGQNKCQRDRDGQEI